MDKVDLEIEYININDKDYFSYSLIDYNDDITRHEVLDKIGIEEINLVKEKIKKIKCLSGVDNNKITTVLNIKAKNNSNSKLEKQLITITIIVPLIEVRLNTIIETAIIESYSTFKFELEKLLHKIERKVLLRPGKIEDITKYDYLILNGEPLRIILSLIMQYCKEKYIANENLVFITNSKIIVEVKNLTNNKVEEIDLLKDGIINSLDYDVSVEKILSIASDRKLEKMKNYLVVDSIINYTTIIAFNTGIMSIVMNVKDEIKNLTYGFTYNTNVVDFIENFYVLNDNKNSIIIGMR
ncbi:hypothetical protein PQ744_08720 [Thermoanaerobacterium thermosaccharolyticum]|uniref:hypothetical protein n=1 Tax=Thermoanaerobacterium thermosaccharolyticum TaxID=1517 RepID=UPI003D2989A6